MTVLNNLTEADIRHAFPPADRGTFERSFPLHDCPRRLSVITIVGPLDMSRFVRARVGVLLAAVGFALGCAKPSGDQPQPGIARAAKPPGRIQNDAVRLSIGDAVTVAVDGPVVPPAPLTTQVASDGSIVIWNSLRIRAADLTPDEVASQIRFELVTNWFHVDKVKVLKVQPDAAPKAAVPHR
jgi:hypothetical protein